MIVSHRYKYIFLKTRKTAGTGIEIALSEHCGPDDIITPIPDEDESLRKKLGFRGPQNYMIPISRYSKPDHLQLLKTFRRKRYEPHMTATVAKQYLGEEIWDTYFKFCFERNPYDKAISRYVLGTRQLERKPSFEQYLETTEPENISNWKIYAIDNNIAIDFVGRYERLAEDLKSISDRLSLPKVLTLPAVRGRTRPKRRHYSQILGLRERVLIEQICNNEINFFSYHWGH